MISHVRNTFNISKTIHIAHHLSSNKSVGESLIQGFAIANVLGHLNIKYLKSLILHVE